MIKKSFYYLLMVITINLFGAALLYIPISQAVDKAVSHQFNEPSAILILGDSLSASLGMQENQGWVYQLNQELVQQKAPYKLINASISGETTHGGLARLPRILAQQSVDYLLIELGGNDGLRGFPPKLIKNNLLQIIKLAKEQKIKVLLMEIRIPPNYGARYNKLFNEIFSKIATQSNVNLLPFFMEVIAITPELMQADGIHPNKRAQPLITQFMKQQLNAIIYSKVTTQTINLTKPELN